MDSKNITEKVNEYLALLMKRDLSNITGLFAKELDWFIPGNTTLAPWTGRRRTNSEVAEFYTQLWKSTEPIAAEVEHFIVQGDFAVITGTFSTKMLATERIVDSPFCIQIGYKDGMIVFYRLLEDSYAVSVSLEN
jgi:ketosteroid isomerase-like protein